MSTLFLVLGLILPRITLLVAWLSDSLPANDTPFALDVVGTIIAPRLLIAYWTHTNQEHVLWTILYVVMFLAVFVGQRRVVVKGGRS